MNSSTQTKTSPYTGYPAVNEATTFVIFGVTGDLALRKLIPALLSLYTNKMLPKSFAIVGVARRPFTRDEFRQFIRDGINVKVGQFKEEDIKHFLDHMSYVQGLFDSADLFRSLATKLEEIDEKLRDCTNKLFHLSVPPVYYSNILDHLSNSGLTIPCVRRNGVEKGWTRVLVEKPFGDDIDTAVALDSKLAKLFNESQIFRIDHYLAKETVQNILAFRFANSIFEPLWNRDHIDRVHIKLLEKIDVEGRGAFYDKVGALKDVGQNHILQMLSLVAMDEPDSFDATNIRKERARVLSNLAPITAKNIAEQATRGQYDGYINEKGVSKDSITETYFRIESYIDSARWKKVPFYLESGKALAESKAEIDVYFKNSAFGSDKSGENKKHVTSDNNSESRQNILTFRIQPDEGIKLRFWVKTPGFGLKVEPKTLKFRYADFPTLSLLPDAYERVLYDAITGDQTLFTSTDEVMAQWEYITPIINDFDNIPLIKYPKGTAYID